MTEPTCFFNKLSGRMIAVLIAVLVIELSTLQSFGADLCRLAVEKALAESHTSERQSSKTEVAHFDIDAYRELLAEPYRKFLGVLGSLENVTSHLRSAEGISRGSGMTAEVFGIQLVHSLQQIGNVIENALNGASPGEQARIKEMGRGLFDEVLGGLEINAQQLREVLFPKGGASIREYNLLGPGTASTQTFTIDRVNRAIAKLHRLVSAATGEAPPELHFVDMALEPSLQDLTDLPDGF